MHALGAPLLLPAPLMAAEAAWMKSCEGSKAEEEAA